MPPTSPVAIMSGFSAILKIGKDEIGIATNVGWNEDFRLQPIEVLNHYGPLDHKSTGWQCSITTGIFILDNEIETITQKTASKASVLSVGIIDMEIQVKTPTVNAVKDRFRGCKTASKNIAYAANALVSGGATWLCLDHV